VFFKKTRLETEHKKRIMKHINNLGSGEMAEEKRYGADLIVESLANHGIDYVFGIPGAKIDRVFETLEHPKSEKSPQLIVARHEQNAAFMAAGIGRLTGKPGVVLTTSGPGASNLATGLVTATAEGDPVLALSGQVKRADLLRSSHQSMRNADLFAPITKYAAEVQDPDNVSEIIANAYQAAESGKQGASFVSIPQDVTDSPVNSEPIKPLVAPKLGPASPSDMTYLAHAIKEASLPVLLLGMRASSSDVTEEIRELLSVTELPVVETFQGAGIISHRQIDRGICYCNTAILSLRSAMIRLNTNHVTGTRMASRASSSLTMCQRKSIITSSQKQS
jgi:acetolactate synthase-1/2/3 large subunit